jgi:hypothetical protein
MIQTRFGLARKNCGLFSTRAARGGFRVLIQGLPTSFSGGVKTMIGERSHNRNL